MLSPQTKKLLLAFLGPLVAAGVAWLTAAVAKYGVHLDTAGIASLATAALVGGIGLVAKLIHDVDRPHVSEFAGITPAQAAELAATLRGLGFRIVEGSPVWGDQAPPASSPPPAPAPSPSSPSSTPPPAPPPASSP